MLENNPLGFPILSWVLWLPGAGGLIILFFVKRHQESLIKWLANMFAFAGFVVSLPLWFAFDPTGPQFQFVERYAHGPRRSFFASRAILSGAGHRVIRPRGPAPAFRGSSDTR